MSLPSLEVAMVGYLHTLSLEADQIGTRIPGHLDGPFVRVQDLGGPQLGRPAWVYENLVQIECYGSTSVNASDGEAEDLHNAIRAALPAMTSDECVVVVVTTTSLGRVPDTTMDPARARFILQATARWRPNAIT